MIQLSAVLSEVNKPGSVFNITYRKVDGSWGEKKSCMLRTSTHSAGGERKRMNRSGTLKLIQQSNNQLLDVYIDFLLTFNGQAINHLY
ncbi:hypothetical protein [Arundinibacter roseus]|uniref:Uncharacterized protein n=1 Tax=Arundinibacter roseus TaxID=2070510 RepID=A0A4R4JYY2_9BACT|nr:hypothetical protein [Arundinibacter roseus]TDB60104.1 hypothetical protein EZE20_21780 [Arundinibacter roseus]TDB66810.1 hypothetical protein EZE20_06705 [Arundinibacter roseus]TDB67126.1 hypothetical protein EZE20_08410 [Arundinibacter roseus]